VPSRVGPSVPTGIQIELFYEFLRLRDTWPNPNIEIKGSSLDESPVRGRKIHLGTFGDEADAARVYDAAARQHFGAFAHCNFPPQMPCTDSASASMISLEGSSA
jgi:hypothetical protein